MKMQLSKIPQRFQKLGEKLNERTSRERAMVLVVALMVIILGWNFLLSAPSSQRKQDLQQQVSSLQRNVQNLEMQAQLVRQAHQENPDVALRERLSQLQKQSRELEQDIQLAMEHMVDPRKMPILLRDILSRQESLSLVLFESIQGGPFMLAGQEVATGATRTFRHGLRMELEGDYFSLLRYLEAVEALPWHFFWETIEYQVMEHPRARIFIEVFTIGSQQQWIGV